MSQTLFSRKEFLQALKSTPHDSFILEGTIKNCVFLFIHGFATYIDDLMPLALAFNNIGYSCELIRLKGHGSTLDELKHVKYDEWYSQLETSISYHKKKKRKVFLVGFSLGALLAIDLAENNKIDGVVGISTFFTPPKQIMSLYRILKYFPNLTYTRLLQVSSKVTKKELFYNSKLSLSLFNPIIKEAAKVRARAYTIHCPVLLLHSYDDKVADYRSIADLYRTLPQNSHFVTFRFLNHFLQFDIPSNRLRDLILAFLKLKPEINTDEASGKSTAKEVYAKVSEEANHWAGNIFNLAVGFFSLFAALAYFSFEAVAKILPSAPYYAVLYALSSNIYLSLIILYFFYLNRSLAYLKHHIEPLFDFTGWISYKSYKWLSGGISTTITGMVSVILLFFVPASISVGAIWYSIYYFPNRLFSFAPSNVFLQTMTFFSVCFLFLNATLASIVSKTSKEELHTGLVRVRRANLIFEKILDELYSSIKTGIVKQPWNC